MIDAESSIAIILAMDDYGEKLTAITRLIEEIKRDTRNRAYEDAALDIAEASAKECEKLRAALMEIRDMCQRLIDETDIIDPGWVVQIAAAALAPEEPR